MNQVVYAAGKLWSGVNTVIRTSNGASSQTDRSGIAYFIVTPSTPSATTVAGTIAKQGYVALGNNDNVLFPSIGVNAAGKGVMTFSISGHHYFPSAGYARIDAVNGAGAIHIAAAGTRRPTTSPDTRRSAVTASPGGATTPPPSPVMTARSGSPRNSSRAASASRPPGELGHVRRQRLTLGARTAHSTRDGAACGRPRSVKRSGPGVEPSQPWAARPHRF